MAQPTLMQPLGMAHNPQAAALLIDRVFNEGRADQYKRELTRNSLQAGATHILHTAIHLPPNAMGEKYGIKAAFVDDGIGMASSKIVDYIGELFNGASALGPDGNFQMGARVSTLPFNRYGLMVASWTEDEPAGVLLEIYYDEDSKAYGVIPQATGTEGIYKETAVPPSYLKHPVIKRAGHGTVFVLMGNAAEVHTVGAIFRNTKTDGFEYPTNRDQTQDLFYYNTKYWELPEDVAIHTMWAPGNLNLWPKLIKSGEYYKPQADDGVGRLQYRRAYGLAERIDKKAESYGTVQVKSQVHGHRATVHWALFPQTSYERSNPKGGGESSERDHFIPLGLFGEKHGDEIYNVQAGGLSTRWMEYYGIGRRELRNRMVLIVEPEAPSARFIGARPSSARDRLLIANETLPHEYWGEAFADKMPQEIKDRLKELDGDTSKDDVDRQRKLRERLREFYTRFRPTEDKNGTPTTDSEVPNADPRATDTERDPDPEPSPPGPKPKPGHRSGFGQVGTDEENATGRGEQTTRRKVRDIQPVWDSEQFGPSVDGSPDRRGMVATFNKASRTLYLNEAHPLLDALIKAELVGRRPDLHEGVIKWARGAIEDHLVATIQASEMFVQSKYTAGQVLGMKFRDHVYSDETLTALCLDVPTMESVIRQRFQGRTGLRRKLAAA